MSAFDVQLRPIDVQLAAVQPEGGEDPVELQLVIAIGMLLPFQLGPDQPLPVAPLGVLRFPFDKTQSEQIGAAFAEAAEKLAQKKAPSSIITPGGPLDEEELAKAAKLGEQLKGK